MTLRFERSLQPTHANNTKHGISKLVGHIGHDARRARRTFVPSDCSGERTHEVKRQRHLAELHTALPAAALKLMLQMLLPAARNR